MTRPPTPLAPSLSASGSTIANRLSPRLLLGIGAALTLLSGPRWHIAALGWFAPVAYLLAARRITSWRGWLAMFGVMLAGAAAAMSTIATPPVPLVAIIGFAAPLAVIAFGSVTLAEVVRRRIGEGAGVFAYAAASTVLTWLGYGVSEFGAWMSRTTSQVEQLELLQLASLGGLGALDFVMGWFAGAVAMLLGAPRATWRLGAVASLAGVLAVALGWGVLRLDDSLGNRHVIVGAVTTDLGMDEHGMPSHDKLAANTEQLFERTKLAAARGARLVVWNEVATVVEPAEEEAFVTRARGLARDLHVDLVLAYAVLVTREPILLDNKYLFITDSGDVVDTYQKHHPVPGEPSIRGSGPLQVIERPYGKVGGAICYDYDFPAIAREHAAAGAELVVIPSSDWRGIDPVHTRMARVRAIENGFSIVRSVRWAASAAFDAHGTALAWMTTDDHDYVMMARVPVGNTPTLYARIGNAVVVLAGAYLAIVVAFAARRRRYMPPYE